MSNPIASNFPTIKRHIGALDYQIFDLDDEIEELLAQRTRLETQRAVFQHQLLKAAAKQAAE